ncbi:hypothetical protein [Alkalibacterium pelagium]|jgi:hypothetical protein|uniref:Uncharacterized protein n=1 Tax=Alkalibacterium pelagium TaxID=426702 RepID=A0A1H7INT2_9LACT|nr:hypothetical protein [Alkalibacterium pelagium]GEN50143.1 hypothetical protein APE02nite_08080 [Alkalibacterium pelagium]SEK63552.1 hypothetical protein SAMN04488099_104189 [Alkalibacterium pelagium]
MQIIVTSNTQEDSLTPKEKQITSVALLNIVSLVNGLTTGKEMVMNPLPDDALGFDIHFSHEASEEEKQNFSGRVVRQLDTFFMMAELDYSTKID